MDTLKTRNKVRNKPRHKISYQAGYNVWGKDRFENLTRQKWNRAKKEFPLRPPSGAWARTSLDNLFSERLRARQVLRQIYGKLTKRQFKTIFNKSEFGHSKSKKSITGLLDRRLDSFVLRLGFSTTIFKARQDVLHGSFKINGKVVKVPGTVVRVGDCVSPHDNVWSAIFTTFQKRMERRVKGDWDLCRPAPLPKYIEFDYRTLTGIVVHEPNLSEISYKGRANVKSVREHYG